MHIATSATGVTCSNQAIACIVYLLVITPVLRSVCNCVLPVVNI